MSGSYFGKGVVMIFTVLGLIFAFVVLGYCTFAMLFMILHGGEEFSSLPLKHMWIAAIIVCVIGYGWYLFFTSLPFEFVLK